MAQRGAATDNRAREVAFTKVKSAIIFARLALNPVEDGVSPQYHACLNICKMAAEDCKALDDEMRTKQLAVVLDLKSQALTGLGKLDEAKSVQAEQQAIMNPYWDKKLNSGATLTELLQESDELKQQSKSRLDMAQRGVAQPKDTNAGAAELKDKAPSKESIIQIIELARKNLEKAKENKNAQDFQAFIKFCDAAAHKAQNYIQVDCLRGMSLLDEIVKLKKEGLIRKIIIEAEQKINSANDEGLAALCDEGIKAAKDYILIDEAQGHFFLGEILELQALGFQRSDRPADAKKIQKERIAVAKELKKIEAEKEELLKIIADPKDQKPEKLLACCNQLISRFPDSSVCELNALIMRSDLLRMANPDQSERDAIKIIDKYKQPIGILLLANIRADQNKIDEAYNLLIGLINEKESAKNHTVEFPFAFFLELFIKCERFRKTNTTKLPLLEADKKQEGSTSNPAELFFARAEKYRAANHVELALEDIKFALWLAKVEFFQLSDVDDGSNQSEINGIQARIKKYEHFQTATQQKLAKQTPEAKFSVPKTGIPLVAKENQDLKDPDRDKKTEPDYYQQAQAALDKPDLPTCLQLCEIEISRCRNQLMARDPIVGNQKLQKILLIKLAALKNSRKPGAKQIFDEMFKIDEQIKAGQADYNGILSKMSSMLDLKLKGLLPATVVKKVRAQIDLANTLHSQYPDYSSEVYIRRAHAYLKLAINLKAINPADAEINACFLKAKADLSEAINKFNDCRAYHILALVNIEEDNYKEAYEAFKKFIFFEKSYDHPYVQQIGGAILKLFLVCEESGAIPGALPKLIRADEKQELTISEDTANLFVQRARNYKIKHNNILLAVNDFKMAIWLFRVCYKNDRAHQVAVELAETEKLLLAEEKNAPTATPAELKTAQTTEVSKESKNQRNYFAEAKTHCKSERHAEARECFVLGMEQENQTTEMVDLASAQEIFSALTACDEELRTFNTASQGLRPALGDLADRLRLFDQREKNLLQFEHHAYLARALVEFERTKNFTNIHIAIWILRHQIKADPEAATKNKLPADLQFMCKLMSAIHTMNMDTIDILCGGLTVRLDQLIVADANVRGAIICFTSALAKHQQEDFANAREDFIKGMASENELNEVKHVGIACEIIFKAFLQCEAAHSINHAVKVGSGNHKSLEEFDSNYFYEKAQANEKTNLKAAIDYLQIAIWICRYQLSSNKVQQHEFLKQLYEAKLQPMLALLKKLIGQQEKSPNPSVTILPTGNQSSAPTKPTVVATVATQPAAEVKAEKPKKKKPKKAKQAAANSVNGVSDQQSKRPTRKERQAAAKINRDAEAAEAAERNKKKAEAEAKREAEAKKQKDELAAQKKQKQEADDKAYQEFKALIEEREVIRKGKKSEMQKIWRHEISSKHFIEKREEEKRQAETAEKETQRLAAEAAEKEKQRLAAEAAEKEKQRLAAEAAEKEKQRLAAEAAEKETQRLAAEAAEKETQRLALAAEQNRLEIIRQIQAQQLNQQQILREARKQISPTGTRSDQSSSPRERSDSVSSYTGSTNSNNSQLSHSPSPDMNKLQPDAFKSIAQTTQVAQQQLRTSPQLPNATQKQIHPNAYLLRGTIRPPQLSIEFISELKKEPENSTPGNPQFTYGVGGLCTSLILGRNPIKYKKNGTTKLDIDQATGANKLQMDNFIQKMNARYQGQCPGDRFTHQYFQLKDGIPVELKDLKEFDESESYICVVHDGVFSNQDGSKQQFKQDLVILCSKFLRSPQYQDDPMGHDAKARDNFLKVLYYDESYRTYAPLPHTLQCIPQRVIRLIDAKSQDYRVYLRGVIDLVDFNGNYSQEFKQVSLPEGIKLLKKEIEDTSPDRNKKLQNLNRFLREKVFSSCNSVRIFRQFLQEGIAEVLFPEISQIDPAKIDSLLEHRHGLRKIYAAFVIMLNFQEFCKTVGNNNLKKENKDLDLLLKHDILKNIQKNPLIADYFNRYKVRVSKQCVSANIEFDDWILPIFKELLGVLMPKPKMVEMAPIYYDPFAEGIMYRGSYYPNRPGYQWCDFGGQLTSVPGTILSKPGDPCPLDIRWQTKSSAHQWCRYPDGRVDQVILPAPKKESPAKKESAPVAEQQNSAPGTSVLGMWGSNNPVAVPAQNGAQNGVTLPAPEGSSATLR